MLDDRRVTILQPYLKVLILEKTYNIIYWYHKSPYRRSIPWNGVIQMYRQAATGSALYNDHKVRGPKCIFYSVMHCPELEPLK